MLLNIPSFATPDFRKEFELPVTSELSLDSLSAKVQVVRGESSKAHVLIQCSQTYFNQDLNLSFNVRTHKLTISQKKTGYGIYGPPKNYKVSIDHAPGVHRIKYDGVDVTDRMHDQQGPNGVEAQPNITVVVPKGTAIEVNSCVNIEINGVQGRIHGNIPPLSRLTANKPIGVDLALDIGSYVQVTNGRGPLKVESLKEAAISTLEAYGAFTDVTLNAYKGSNFSLSGTVAKVGGCAIEDSVIIIQGVIENEKPNILTDTTSTTLFNNHIIGGGRNITEVDHRIGFYHPIISPDGSLSFEKQTPVAIALLKSPTNTHAMDVLAEQQQSKKIRDRTAKATRGCIMM
jgi:hypothetical protein